MTRKNSQLFTLALVGVGVYLLMKGSNTPPHYNYPQIPPAPPPNTQQWQQWVAVIAQTFGTVADLWAPGGPFYKQPITPAQAQAIEQAWSNYLFH